MENTNTNENVNGAVQADQVQQEALKTYTQEEFDKALQSQVDKRVTQAMQTAQKKADARVKEAKKLAAMNEQQRYEYELDSREKAIAEKEKALALAENKATAASVLADRGISAKLVDFVVAEDADTMMERIKTLEKNLRHQLRLRLKRGQQLQHLRKTYLLTK